MYGFAAYYSTPFSVGGQGRVVLRVDAGTYSLRCFPGCHAAHPSLPSPPPCADYGKSAASPSKRSPTAQASP